MNKTIKCKIHAVSEKREGKSKPRPSVKPNNRTETHNQKGPSLFYFLFPKRPKITHFMNQNMTK